VAKGTIPIHGQFHYELFDFNRISIAQTEERDSLDAEPPEDHGAEREGHGAEHGSHGPRHEGPAAGGHEAQ
jgi:hypothetical protein